MGFATHFMADLYLCQNPLWLAPMAFRDKIRALVGSKNIIDFEIVYQSFISGQIRISGEIDDSFLLLQIFPADSFLTVDIYSWKPKGDVENFSEALIDLFAPQVVAFESKVRAEHLHN